MNILEKIVITMRTVVNLNTFVLDYLKLIKDQRILYRLRNGLNFVARAGGVDISEVIVVNSDAEYPKLYYKDLKNPIVLDIGANIGSFSLYFANVFRGKPFVVYAIEPSLENYKILEENIKINGFFDQIKASNLAIGNKDGVGYLNIEGNFDAFFLSDIKDNNTQEIKVIKLETFCEENLISRIDLLKVDIEGGEYDLFYNSISFIKESVCYIFIEVHELNENRNIKVFKNFLERNGFSVMFENGNILYLVNNNLIVK